MRPEAETQNGDRGSVISRRKHAAEGRLDAKNPPSIAGNHLDLSSPFRLSTRVVKNDRCARPPVIANKINLAYRGFHKAIEKIPAHARVVFGYVPLVEMRQVD